MEAQRNGRQSRWALDIESLHRAVSKKTRLIVVTNPNNPTGAVLNQEEMDEVVRVARKARAWLLVDEIYRGAEVNGPLTPTFWGRYDKAADHFWTLQGFRITRAAPGMDRRAAEDDRQALLLP